jgi:alkaline phosphatase D
MRSSARFYDHAVARLTRRQFLNAAWALGAAAVAHPPFDSRVLATPIFDAYPFSLGVASGDPLPDNVILWTRLAPKPLEGGGMPMAAVGVEWEVARDRTFRQVVRTGTALARPELGHSVHVEVAGLEPARDYWYRFRVGDERSHIGRTRTAPPPGAAVESLRFAVCGCSHYEAGYFTAYRRIAEEGFDFVFHTGDYIYEARADGGRTDGRVRQHHRDEIYTLVDYRNRYGQYKSDPDLIAAHASAPFILTWDDHEVDNNYAGDVDENDTPPEVFLLRRAAAYQAYYEHMPLRAGAFPSPRGLRLYRRLQFGNVIDLSVLDTRQYRSDQACGDENRTGCAGALDPARTMLGLEQERWLYENLTAARSTWTVVGQQVPTYPRDRSRFDPNGQFSMDKWDGYAAARARLYARLRDTRAPNPVVLSGDVHQHFAADLKLDYGRPESPTIGVELTNSSISSGGDGTEVALEWETIRPDNPHVRLHSARRGYIGCTATPDLLRAEFRVLDRVTVPDLPARTHAALVVEAGRPGAVSA